MKNKNTKYLIPYAKYENGFTLIEILIFTAIVSVFFVVAVYVSSFSLSIMRTNENKIYAAHYAEEASEWLLNEKDSTDWIVFSGYATSPNNSWCMNTLALTSGACPTSLAGSYTLGFEYNRQFNRDVVLSNLGDGTISSSVTVSWKDIGGTLLYVPIKTIYAQTE